MEIGRSIWIQCNIWESLGTSLETCSIGPSVTFVSSQWTRIRPFLSSRVGHRQSWCGGVKGGSGNGSTARFRTACNSKVVPLQHPQMLGHEITIWISMDERWMVLEWHWTISDGFWKRMGFMCFWYLPSKWLICLSLFLFTLWQKIEVCSLEAVVFHEDSAACQQCDWAAKQDLLCAVDMNWKSQPARQCVITSLQWIEVFRPEDLLTNDSSLIVEAPEIITSVRTSMIQECQHMGAQTHCVY